MKILIADHVLPVASKPIENGAVVVDKDKIAGIGPKSEILAKHPGIECEEFGASVLMPGFINCHAHLELTAMRGFLDEFDGDFFSWLMKLTKTRAERLSEDDLKTSAIFGAVEAIRAGVTCCGDIGRLGIAGFEALKATGLRGILFQETEFSPLNSSAMEDFERLSEKIHNLKNSETDLVKVGISPHAPYTVSEKLFGLLAEFALDTDLQVTIHAAESNEEVAFLKTGSGFFADMFAKFAIEWKAPGMSPIEFLEKTGILRTKPLLAHCVKVSKTDLDRIAESGARIAHCPKSNAKFGHGAAPFGHFIEKGIDFGLGSDSMASNNVCDILEEARFAALIGRTGTEENKFHSPQKLIETATIGGARALGLESKTGALEVGKQADIVAVGLNNFAQMPVHDIYSTLLFATSARDVKMTMVSGKVLYRDNRLTEIDENALKLKMNKIAAKMR